MNKTGKNNDDFKKYKAKRTIHEIYREDIVFTLLDIHSLMDVIGDNHSSKSSNVLIWEKTVGFMS